jgi:hypothetical protein
MRRTWHMYSTGLCIVLSSCTISTSIIFHGNQYVLARVTRVSAHKHAANGTTHVRSTAPLLYCFTTSPQSLILPAHVERPSHLHLTALFSPTYPAALFCLSPRVRNIYSILGSQGLFHHQLIAPLSLIARQRPPPKQDSTRIMEHTTATDDGKTTPKLSTRQDERAPVPHPITRKVPIFQRNSLSTWDMPNPWARLK